MPCSEPVLEESDGAYEEHRLYTNGSHGDWDNEPAPSDSLYQWIEGRDSRWGQAREMIAEFQKKYTRKIRCVIHDYIPSTRISISEETLSGMFHFSHFLLFL